MSTGSGDKPGILVPVKRLEDAKTRLEPVLGRDQRKRLSRALARDTVEHLRQLKTRANVAVVTSDPEVKTCAGEKGVHVCPEPEPAANLGEIVDRAGSRRWYQPEAGLLVFPVDLPWVTPRSIEALLQECTSEPAVVVPDRQRKGTNALWRKPADLFPCQYSGTSSFRSHRRVARSSGHTPAVNPDPLFGFDLDTAEDWEQFTRRPSRLSENTRSFLLRYFSGIQDRIPGL